MRSSEHNFGTSRVQFGPLRVRGQRELSAIVIHGFSKCLNVCELS